MLPRHSFLRTFRPYSTQSPHPFTSLIRNPSLTHQIYISRSPDPFLNLSIEHHLLQHSHKASTILFLYINSPCVVIGRNQNPWLEANLRVVGPRAHDEGSKEGIKLVRRRSGGGTVFHDERNVNYSVICPTAAFTRDKHAEMVARAMRVFNPRARVNERHDIVLDQGSLRAEERRPDKGDLHQTAYISEEKIPRKVSGSAFKLTKERALHHGTCLLGSDLEAVRRCLRSEARGFVKARGVDSVSSPVGNLFASCGEGDMNGFVEEVVKQFRSLYGLEAKEMDDTVLVRELFTKEGSRVDGNRVLGSAGEELLPEVHSGVEEIQSLDWTYRQTPQFILSSHSIDEDSRERPPLPDGWSSSARVYVKVRSGVITSCKISISADLETARMEEEASRHLLVDRVVHDIADFNEVLKLRPAFRTRKETNVVAAWLNRMFGIRTG